jgi:hypothetical protein
MHWTDVRKNHRAFRALQRAAYAAALVAILLPTGCVRRRLAVRSNPPGAVVFVDNQHIGTTPCSVDFTYYGTREIRLIKPGFETLTVNQPIPTPWYQIPPIDFVSENLLPNKITDHRTVAFNLEPQLIVPTEQLIERGNQLRQETQAGAGGLPPAAVVVPGPTINPSVGAPATMPPMFAPPESFAPTPAPATQPVPLPPVTQSPAIQSPAYEIAPPTTYGPSTTAPVTTPGGTTPSPFTPPDLPGATQIGPPITSPPLRKIEM